MSEERSTGDVTKRPKRKTKYKGSPKKTVTAKSDSPPAKSAAGGKLMKGNR